MPTFLRKRLLSLQARDLALRDQLQAEGTLFDGYHPRMEEVHRENAQQLRELTEQHGWPNEQLAGQDGAEAAWLIAQHAIAEPEFMRRCRALLQQQAALAAVPIWQYAYIHDRIRVFEGLPQTFGTQIHLTPEGPRVCEVEDPQSLDQRRKQAGLGPIRKRLESMQGLPLPTRVEYATRKKAEALWRLKVGWRAEADG
jgi:hypothetical protein